MVYGTKQSAFTENGEPSLWRAETITVTSALPSKKQLGQRYLSLVKSRPVTPGRGVERFKPAEQS